MWLINLRYKHKITVEFNNKWSKESHSDRSNTAHRNKLPTYRLYTSHPVQETYMSIINSISERSIYTKFRLRAHMLDIEKLRYTFNGNRLTPEQRMCKYCTLTLNEIANGTHFLV